MYGRLWLCTCELSLVLAAGSDYTPINTTLTFTPRDSSEQCGYITILQDNIVEDPENFLIHLATSDEDVKLQYNYSTITILDNDGMKVQRAANQYASLCYSSMYLTSTGCFALCICYGACLFILVLCLCCVWCGCGDVVSKGVEFSFVETDYTVDEGEGVQHVCVEVTGALETSIRVTVDTQPYTALGMVWYFTLREHRFSSMLMIIKIPTSLCKVDNNSVHVHYWTHEVIRCITKHWSILLTLLAHSVFYLEKWTRGGKIILRENLGGPRDCAQQCSL